MTEQAAWIWFSLGIGPGGDAEPLLDRFGSVREIYAADEKALREVPGLSPRTLARLCDKNTDTAERIEEYCVRHCVGILSLDSKCYPDRLRRIRKPPALLYYKGKLPYADQQLCIAIVGTRKMSDYGRRTAYRLGYEIGGCGAVVVSGMALGIDGMAQQGALDAGAHTVAVLGCGIDTVYPAAHRGLMEELSLRGTILTEYAPGEKPETWHFPQRNRIISGLSQGTLVVEAGEKSGAIITAELAIEQGRDVYAVPGNIDRPNSGGNNALLRDGVRIATCAEDVLRQYLPLYRDTVSPERMADPLFYNTYSDAPRFGSDSASPRRGKTPAAPRKTVVNETPNTPAGQPAAARVDPGEPAQSAPEPVPVTFDEGTDEGKILNAARGGATCDEITARTGLDPRVVSSLLLMLEIDGKVRSLAGGRYQTETDK